MKREQRLFAVTDIIQRIAAAPTNDHALYIFQEFAKSLGFTSLVVGMTDGPAGSNHVSFANTSPIEWIERYFAERLFEQDPVVRHLTKTNRPFTWSQAIMGPDDQAFFSKSAEHKLGQGYMIPILEPNGALGAVSLGGERIDDDPQALTSLHVIGIYTYYRLRNQAPLSGFGPSEPVALTPQQKRVLGHLVNGKTNWEIGYILGISERTVGYHVEQIFKRLNVTKRAQAAVVALSKGLI
jgi:LuxR family quorum sensing-dependent transcriptional regulator